MNALQEELPNLVITLAVLILIGVLLGLRIVPSSDTLITGTVPVMISYWFLRGAFKYTPTPTVVTIPATTTEKIPS